MELSRPSEKELAAIKAAAENTFRKDRRITIRLYDHDFKGIQKKALQLGCPTRRLSRRLSIGMLKGIWSRRMGESEKAHSSMLKAQSDSDGRACVGAAFSRDSFDRAGIVNGERILELRDS
jgi:hypothetical protein